MDFTEVLKRCEDYLFPALHMNVRERSLYYHLLRHTRLLGTDSGLFAIAPLANALDLAESTVREGIRSLHERGCIKIEDRSRLGHRITVLLPEEIGGVLPQTGDMADVDIESLDFFSERRYLQALFAREHGACFYCLRKVRSENCELDHVVSRINGSDNSYRNIVVSCHECNTTKQAKEPDDFLRTLYRRGVLSQTELEDRLVVLEQLQSGKLVPDLSMAGAI